MQDLRPFIIQSVKGDCRDIVILEGRRVGIGTVDLPPFRAGVLDLNPLRLGIQAILGVNAFAGYRVQLDFAEGRVYLLS